MVLKSSAKQLTSIALEFGARLESILINNDYALSMVYCELLMLKKGENTNLH